MKKPRVQKTFLDELRKISNVQVACERCNLSRQSVYRWRREDSEFATRMDEALNEGDAVVNDLCESKLLTLIKKEHFGAIRFFLTKRHPKYKEVLEERKEALEAAPEEIIRALGLTDDDFRDENVEKTKKTVLNYLERL